jgi:hypothetical protein
LARGRKCGVPTTPAAAVFESIELIASEPKPSEQRRSISRRERAEEIGDMAGGSN